MKSNNSYEKNSNSSGIKDNGFTRDEVKPVKMNAALNNLVLLRTSKKVSEMLQTR